jgi:long-chain-fatty-acid--[acyl-carrier-protein] ligase
MLSLLRFPLWLFSKMVLLLRYRVTVRGWKQIQKLKPPILVLPNHPAFVDPVIVVNYLYRSLNPRPLLFASMFANPVLRPMMKILDALELPDTDKASRRARQKAERAIQQLIEGLRAGRNHIMWPAGRAERNGKEVLGGARALSDVLKAVPEASVLLVHTRGLFGSMFSYAQTGKAPNLFGNLLRGIGYLLASLIFFLPRRKVEITLEAFDRSKLPGTERDQVNRWFEDWYNRLGPEPPTYRPYHFLIGRRDFDWPKPDTGTAVDLERIKPETKEQVTEILAKKLGRPLSAEEQRPDTTLDQLGLDSLDRMDLNQRVEQRFGFSGDDVPATVGQLWALAQGLAQRAAAKPPPAAWFRPPSDTGPVTILGDTIPEAFVARALANRRDVASADDLAGVLTYERLLVGALTVSRRLSRLPGTNVGLLLPSSVGCDVAFLALHLAGKLPVVLNWTTGQGNLEHAVRVMELTHVVTSEVFLDRLDLDLPGVEFVYLEDVRQDTGKLELLRTLLRVRWFSGSVRSSVPRPDPDLNAVVLFTSGSEKAPKAVPLTHRNILTDVAGCATVLKLSRNESVLAFLPAFHSFGMSVTGVLPLLGGIRAIRHADPTDAGGLARKVAAYKPTLLASTPTFVSYILDRSEAGQMASLRLIVVGAEKCPPALFERVKSAAPAAALVEGYGITECSPVVSVNPPEANRPGTIGKPLPKVEVTVVDLENDRPVPAGEQGMLLVAGPTIFPGYVGQETSPFREVDGRRWYVTGDLARLDAEGYIHFAGRLKRFLKAGGEMISLPALEEPIARQHPPTKDGPQVAVEGVEQDHGGRRVALFTTLPIGLSEANDMLEREGFRGVMRLTEVQRIDRIPVLGTGKTDYKVLRAMLTGKA